MKLLSIISLLTLGIGVAHSQEEIDPFADPTARIEQPAIPLGQAPIKVKTQFTCVSSGTMEGKVLDDRTRSIVIAISEFHKKHQRVPKEITELIVYCKKRGLKLHQLRSLSIVKYKGDTFKYSASYGEGTLHLSHTSGSYLTSDMLGSTKTEE